MTTVASSSMLRRMPRVSAPHDLRGLAEERGYRIHVNQPCCSSLSQATAHGSLVDSVRELPCGPWSRSSDSAG
jgi:hypothetical protein